MNFKVAKRYAKGLFDFAEQTNETDAIYKELKDVSTVLAENRELKNLFKSPIVDSRKKQVISNEIFASLSPSVKKFIALVIQQGRETHLQDMASIYHNLVDAKNNLQKVTLVTATAIDQEALENIVKSCSFVDPTKPVVIQNQVDESIIGGYIIKLSDKQFDTSIKSKLHQIRQNFDFNEYIPTK